MNSELCGWDHNKLLPSEVYLVRGEGWKCGRCRTVLPDYIPNSVRCQSFEPIVVHIRASDGEISIPARTDEKVPDGYYKKELTSLREVDRFCRGMSNRETQKKKLTVEAEKQYWDERTKRRREQVRSEMERRGMKTKYFDAVCKYVDRKREQRYRQLKNKEVTVFPKIFSYDDRESHSYRDVDTGFHIKRY